MRHQLAANLCCAGMEDLYACHLCRQAQSADGKTCLVAAGIAGRAGNHANCGAWLPAQGRFSQAAIDTGLQRIDQIAFQPDENGLRLRIAKARIELQHLGAARRHHQAAVENAFERHAFLCHATHHRLGNVAQNPL